jgi:acyl-[acyl carrier protein]--UDP-N-acetylglucosamine O-acyltransferase
MFKLLIKKFRKRKQNHSSSFSVLSQAHIGGGFSTRDHVRLGSTASLHGNVDMFGKASVTSFCRMGSDVTVKDQVLLQKDVQNLSASNQVEFASSLSVRSFVRIQGTVSVAEDLAGIGSTISVRAFVRLGSTLSVHKKAVLSASASICSYGTFGSSLSLRSFTRLGSGVSILEFAHLGSSLSLRSYIRFGSGISVYNRTNVGLAASIMGGFSGSSSLSVRSFVRFGDKASITEDANLSSTVSVRGFARLGANRLSVLDWANFGSSISVRSFVQMHDGLSVFGDGSSNIKSKQTKPYYESLRF